VNPSRTELRRQIEAELTQRRLEGCDVAAIERVLARRGLSAAGLERLWPRLEGLKVRRGFGFQEPSALSAIRAQRPRRRRKAAKMARSRVIEDKVHGAWLGRAAGCLLGKPVEGRGREWIERWLRQTDAFPLDDYFAYVESPPEEFSRFGRPSPVLRPFIHGMARDDDMDYPILGLDVLEGHGPAFTSEQVIDRWLLRLPYHCVYTAERVAYANRVAGLPVPQTATVRNPFREWIGAQIRADVWGWVSPARPQQAAELAFRDAQISHVKNGIYGEMFVAAMLAAAFVTDDVREIIGTGLGEIPQACRLRAAVDLCLKTYDREDCWSDAWDAVMAEVGHYHGVHTINNACLVVLALLYGEGDFARTICLAVQGGLDTDCNGATAGSIAGVMLGAAALPHKWTAPLNDRLTSMVAGFHDSRISNLAERTIAQQRLVAARFEA